MANTGIKHLDVMPGRVGISDVDAWRATYASARNKIAKEREIMIKAREKLESIYKKWKKDGVTEE